jgi:hypothetical protein
MLRELEESIREEMESRRQSFVQLWERLTERIIVWMSRGFLRASR